MIVKVHLGLFLACILAVYAVERENERVPVLVLNENNSKADPPRGCMQTDPVARGRSVCRNRQAVYGSKEAEAAKAEASKRALGEEKQLATPRRFGIPQSFGRCQSMYRYIVHWVNFCWGGHCTWAFIFPAVIVRDCLHHNRCCEWWRWWCRCQDVYADSYAWLVIPNWWGQHGGICRWPGWCIMRVRIRYRNGCRCPCSCGL